MWFLLFIITFFVENGLLIFSIIIGVGIVLGIFLSIKFDKRKENMENNIFSDERFLNAKTFNSELDIPIKVSEKGFLGIIDHFIGEIRVIDIKDINGYELQINENKNTVDSKGIIGTLLGGSSNIEKKVNSIKVILKMNNFNEPIIEIPFLSSEIYTNSSKYNNIQNEINQFIGTLDYLRNKKAKENDYAG